MVIKKRKKSSRLLGSRSYGWGARHRGSGKRGGVGRAGSGKKADQKKPSFWKINTKKQGFAPKGTITPVYAINLIDIENKINQWIKKGLAKKENNYFIINLKKLGYTKILSKGKLTNKFKITVQSFSKKALEKIKSSGSEITKE